ncbi:MAG: polysaccharide deacetylase [Clostridium sp.]|nr:polysaccharide deacetylase [Clostridium sp.]
MKRNCILINTVFAILFTFLLSNSIYGYDLNKNNISFTNQKNSNAKTPKKVFLTFDDGPSPNNTRKILKILKDNNVKATFFVVGIKAEENPDILKELSNNGMSIGIHCYSHNYKNLYRNLSSYENDYKKCETSIKKITGKNPIPYVRLPGGSTNSFLDKSVLISIKNSLNKNKIDYVDWNVCSGDADSHVVPVEKIKNNIKLQCQDKDIAVILMHDTYYKYFTVDSLPDVIKYLKNQGFVFRSFDNLTEYEKNEMINNKIMNN